MRCDAAAITIAGRVHIAIARLPRALAAVTTQHRPRACTICLPTPSPAAPIPSFITSARRSQLAHTLSPPVRTPHGRHRLRLQIAEPTELDAPQPVSESDDAMDAVSCAGVAPQSALLSHSSFADAAIARALHSSLSGHAPEPPATTAAATLMYAAVAGTDCPPAGASPSPSPSARCRLGPAGGRAGKRHRPRPSKRAPTTYIRADAATFRAMVQRVTGADEDDLQPQQQDGDSLVLLLPHLGVEQFLQAAGPAPHVAAAAPYTTASPAAAAEQQPLFPTLDSWNVMYGKKDEVVSALTDGR